MTRELPPAIAAVVRLWIARVGSQHSRRAYLADVDGFVTYAQLDDLEHASLAHLVDWRDALEAAGLAPASVARRLSTIGSLASFAHAAGAIPRNFALLAKKPRVVSQLPERTLPVDYIAMLVQAGATERDRAMLRLLYYTGCRCNELAQLRWRSLAVNERGRGVVSLSGKGQKRIYVLVPAWLYAALVRLRGAAGDDEPMFRGRGGRCLSTRQVHRVVAAAAVRGRVPGRISPHWLRHAHVSHALEGGAPIALVQRDAGHASLETTGRYAHARPDDGSSMYLPVI